MKEVRLPVHFIFRFTRLLRLVALVALAIPAWAQAPGDQAATGVRDLPAISPSVRATWVLHATVGPTRLIAVPLQSGILTWADSPREYGTHWGGFGQRVGSSLATAALGNTMEASIGSLWGEDPRYHRLGSGSASSRIKHALITGFMAEKASGELRPAYARFIAVTSSHIISNSWREPSEVGPDETARRIGFAFVARMGGHVFAEFWPDIRRLLPGKKR